MSDQNKKPTEKKKRLQFKWSHLLILVALFLIVVGVTTIGTVVTAALVSMPALDDSSIENYDVTSYVLDKDGALVEKMLPSSNQISIKYDEISPNMINALIAVEDKRFKSHNGVDLVRIAGAAMANLRAGHTVQGGSTITQQLAGMAMLDRTEKSYTRKLQEAVLAVRIENRYSKEEIITSYLNRAYFGIGNSGRSAYGVEAAANDFFGKKAKDLNVDEAAMLAGMIQNPTTWSPIGNPENAVQRRAIVLQAMQGSKFISADEYSTLNAAPLALSSITPPANSESKSFNQSYYDTVVAEAQEILKLEKAEDLFSGGYYIHTSLNQDLQQYMYNYFNNDYYFPYGSQAAMVVMDPSNGTVAGLIGGRHLDENKDMQFNRATQATRQPGSSFKPIAVYAPAFEKGYGTGSIFYDAPYTDYMGHTIKNAELKYSGNTSVRAALIDSLNTVAVRVIEEIGIDYAVNFAKNLGITSLVESGDVSDMNLSTALGGLTNGVSPIEMAGAYGAFANDGVYIKPHCIIKITDTQGKIIWEKEPESHRAMSAPTAYMITSCLQSAVQQGTGRYAAIYDGRPIAGKTGTTDFSKDFWFAGYTPNYVGVVWVGYDTPTVMYGTSDVSAVIFANIMSYAHRGLEVKEFARPEGVVDVLVDVKAGGLATRSTPYGFRRTELWREGTEPTTYSTGNYVYYVDPNAKKKTTTTTQAPRQQAATTTQTQTATQNTTATTTPTTTPTTGGTTTNTTTPTATPVAPATGGTGGAGNAA